MYSTVVWIHFLKNHYPIHHDWNCQVCHSPFSVVNHQKNQCHSLYRPHYPFLPHQQHSSLWRHRCYCCYGTAVQWTSLVVENGLSHAIRDLLVTNHCLDMIEKLVFKVSWGIWLEGHVFVGLNICLVQAGHNQSSLNLKMNSSVKYDEWMYKSWWMNV